jgi:hypothetical protein
MKVKSVNVKAGVNTENGFRYLACIDTQRRFNIRKEIKEIKPISKTI